MPGPNSAPNGDVTLIKGHKREIYYYCQCKDYDHYKHLPIPARDWLARRGRLYTGKTER